MTTITPPTVAQRPTLRWLEAALGSPAWVDARPFRAHLDHLIGTSGLHWRVVARCCGLPALTAQRLVATEPGCGPPLRRISHISAARLLSVRPAHLAALTRGTVPAAATVARLHRLLRRGHGLPEIAGAVGGEGAALARLLEDRPRRCSRLLQWQVDAAWEHLTGEAEPGPGGL